VKLLPQTIFKEIFMAVNVSDFGYLMKSIPNYSIAWLLLSSVFMVLVGYATYYFITRKEISEKIKKGVEAEQIKIVLKLKEEAKASEDARVRAEVIRWANPSEIAVNGLYYRGFRLTSFQATSLKYPLNR
jgi:hypothetical protein